MAGDWWLGMGRRAATRVSHQPPATHHPSVIAACRQAVEEGAGRPGLARCLNVLPFRRSRPAPRSRYPRALRVAALLRAWPDHRRRPCGRRRAADMAGFPVSDPPRGARRAGAGHPSTSARTPGLSSARASSLDHSPPPSRTWIRRPPHRRDGRECRTGKSCGGEMTLRFPKDAKKQRNDREICSVCRQACRARAQASPAWLGRPARLEGRS